MKKYVIFLILNFLVPFMVVNASTEAPNECIDNNTCMLLCNYENNFSGTMRSMSIYYHYNGNWEVRYWNQIENSFKGGKGPGSYQSIFSTTGSPNIYWLTGVNEANFKCPSHGYFDRNAFTELCFADSQEACEAKSGWTATKFGSDDSAFKSDKKDYDFIEQIKTYNVMADIKQDIANGTFNVKEDFVNKTMKDFQDNFLGGHDVPLFIKNSEAYQNLETKAGEDYAAAKANALKEAQAAKEDPTYVIAKRDIRTYCGKDDEESKLRCEEAKKLVGAVDQDVAEKTEQVKNNYSADPDEVKEQVGIAISNLNMKVDWNADFDVDSNCDSYLGNPLTPGKPAYYMQFIFNLMKYIAIILLFVLSIVDFAKAITAGKDDALKKASITAVKRLIIVVIIFFLPNLMKFLLTLLGAYSADTCGIS